MIKENQYLINYLDNYNRLAKLFKGKDPISLEDCKNEKIYMKLFLDLNTKLSPECLSCDGELQGKALMSKAKMLNGAWNDLAKLTGTSFEKEDPRLYEYNDKNLSE